MKTGVLCLLTVLLAACTSSDSQPKPATTPTSADDASKSRATKGPGETPPPKADPGVAAAGGDENKEEPPEPEPEPEPKAGKNFADDITVLYKLVACGSDTPPENTVRPGYFKRHCANLERAIERYRRRWYEKAVPHLAKIVPDDIPDVLVYPFGGGDLLTALATFPDAKEITTLSLELAGDVTLPEKMSRARLESVLTKTRKFARYLLQVVHSKTSNMRQVMRSVLPAQLVFGMLAMKINGLEPVSMRYFTLEADGSIKYYEEEELKAAIDEAKGKRQEAKVFANAEIEFRKKGTDGPLRVWRHFGANLDDEHLAKNKALIKHLEAKGKVAAMTKAASYLLWWKNFSTIRQYLLDNMVWMISDATGLMPKAASEAGFEQITYGWFEKAFLPGAGPRGTNQYRKLYRSQKRRKLGYRYGYPDGSPKKHSHMIVTRKKK